VLLANGDVLTVPDRQNRKVFLLGELAQPKSLLLRRSGVTLAEVLGEAGGPNPLSSNAGQIYVIRADPVNNALVYQLDAREPTALILADRFEIMPRDMVYVNPTSLTRLGRAIGQLLPTVTGVGTIKTAVGL
jgi:polysaccharide biosynthesis/export protein